MLPEGWIGKEQSSDGNLEQETEEKWVSCDPEARDDRSVSEGI